MESQYDQQARIEALQERRKLLAILISEYIDRLKYDDLREDELDRSTQELAVLQAQMQSIDAALVQGETDSDVKSPHASSD